MQYAKSLIFEWQNAIFTASIVFWMIYLFVSLLGGGGHEHIDVGHDADSDGDVHHGVSANHENESFNLLSYLGIGRCPISIVLMLLGVCWGFIGLVCNGFFDIIKIIPPILYFWASALVALIIALPFTSYTSKLVAKIMPRKGTTAIELDSLVGKTGESSVTIDAKGGRVRVLDGFGTQHNIYCRTGLEEPEIPPNTAVLVLSRMPNGLFVVKKKPNIIIRE
jgi:hypothetical protein